jgi:hypothetical protein
MPSRFLPVGKDARGAARFLLAALPALGALLTALAITGDLVGRMARNHPHATLAAFGCAALAVFLGAVAAFGLHENSVEERAVLYLGLGVLGCALVFGVYAGVQTWGDRTQPSITVTPKRNSVIVAVRGTGLRSSDHLIVEVDRIDGANQPLYGGSFGPDNAGVVDQTIDVPLPAGDFDELGARAWVGRKPAPCYARANTTGCVHVHIPRTQERPQLAVEWETFVRAPRIRITLRAQNLSVDPRRAMTLRVFGLVPGVTPRALAEWSLAPNAEGVFDRRLSVVVGHAYSDVCIVASLSQAEPACPPTRDALTVWTQLAVPTS